MGGPVAANIAVVPRFELGRQKLPDVQAFSDDGKWAESGLSGFGLELRQSRHLRTCVMVKR